MDKSVDFIWKSNIKFEMIWDLTEMIFDTLFIFSKDNWQ